MKSTGGPHRPSTPTDDLAHWRCPRRIVPVREETAILRVQRSWSSSTARRRHQTLTVLANANSDDANFDSFTIKQKLRFEVSNCSQSRSVISPRMSNRQTVRHLNYTATHTITLYSPDDSSYDGAIFSLFLHQATAHSHVLTLSSCLFPPITLLTNNRPGLHPFTSSTSSFA